MQEPGFQMLLPVNWKMQKIYEKMFQSIRHTHNLTQNEIDVLLFLAGNKENNTAMDVVLYRATSKSLVSKSVDSLVKRGFLQTKTDEKDRRYTRLYITPQAGHIMLMLLGTQGKFFKTLEENMTEEGMTEEEKTQLKECTMKLYSALYRNL